MGIDVGGRRKGFHAAAVNERALVAGPKQIGGVDAVLGWVDELRPEVVALDSPKTCAFKGERSRADERALAKEICGIRWTPEMAKLNGNPYYEWIACGLELYEALEPDRSRRRWRVIEVFPTASWSVWVGRRGKRTRARWTREALADTKLEGLPFRRLNQDDRDAIAAALTARQHDDHGTRRFGEIVVPKGPLH